MGMQGRGRGGREKGREGRDMEKGREGIGGGVGRGRRMSIAHPLFSA